MMTGMMSCTGWGMGLVQVLVLTVLVLGTAALARYLFWGGR